ncbi:MAG: hypothetical protein LBQ59_00090 [Candidatus Peribacteria bacterium]|jgi:hypothetical protein|nr:hypothetical protein [Candidatus Peribacteria bacterium]
MANLMWKHISKDLDSVSNWHNIRTETEKKEYIKSTLKDIISGLIFANSTREVRLRANTQ